MAEIKASQADPIACGTFKKCAETYANACYTQEPKNKLMSDVPTPGFVRQKCVDAYTSLHNIIQPAQSGHYWNCWFGGRSGDMKLKYNVDGAFYCTEQRKSNNPLCYSVLGLFTVCGTHPIFELVGNIFDVDQAQAFTRAADRSRNYEKILSK